MNKLSALSAAFFLAFMLPQAAYALSSMKDFTVTNKGNAPLHVSDVAISGNTDEYRLVWSTCTEPVPAGGNCSLWAIFEPLAGGARPPASLDFKSDGANGPNHSIALKGAGAVLPPANCKALLASAPGTPSGYYTIQPVKAVGAAQYSAYCDMTTDGGGWTRVNASLVQTSSRAFGANDVVSGNNAPTVSCEDVKSNWIVTKPVIGYSSIRINFTRTTTIMQCASIYSGTAVLSGMVGEYWSGSAWVSNSTGIWNDNVWAHGDVYTRSLPKTWRINSGWSPDGIIKFNTLCSYPDDTGAFTATMWLR